MSKKKQIPVTIITGFLGAGKTTFLNEILRQNPDTKFLIIENDSGELNIDGELIKKASNNALFELSDGCVCCTRNGDLGTLLNSIILSKMDYDYMLIEASGMAFPGPVIELFSGKRVQRFFTLDGVISLVDAVSFKKRLEEYDIVRKQVVDSDFILVNKTDSISHEELNEIELEIASINPLAQIKKATFGKIDSTQILNSEQYAASNVEGSIRDTEILTPLKPFQNNIHGIQTISLTMSIPFNEKAFSKWMDEFLRTHKILRVKGILNFESVNHKVALQSVGKHFHMTHGDPWPKNKLRASKMVFIGSDLDQFKIQNGLFSIVAKTDSMSA